jgi:FlgD Ig-like domain
MRPGRILLAVLAIAAALSRPAFAQSEPSSWLLKYISFYSNVGGNPPNTSEPTIIRLYGWFPYDCGVVRNAYAQVDTGHIYFDLVKASDICGDTTRTWSIDFNFGYLTSGDHTFMITRKFVNAAHTDSVTESASFTFPVVDLGDPPPPPPPPGPQPPNWVVPWVAYGYTIPSQPNALEPTTLVLHGLVPYDCGEVVDVTSDSASVSFTLQPGPACGDTVRTWTQQFPLGTLSAGFHAIHVTRRFISPDSNVVAQGDLGFNVWPDASHPPRDTTVEYPSVLVRCLSGWTTTTPPTTHAPTTLVVWGWYPYLCGEIESAYVYDPHRVIINLARRASCGSDTVVTWTQTFDLGTLPAGSYPITIELNVPNDPNQQASVSRNAAITLWVDDREVSASVPNPFVADTRFSVNSSKSEALDVGIYDLHGRRVKTVFPGAIAPGASLFRWDGTRDDGSRAAIGIYFSRVAFSDRVVTRKLVMLPR